MAKMRYAGIILAVVFFVVMLCGCPGDYDITSIISSIVSAPENEPGDESGEGNDIVAPPGDESEEDNDEVALDFPVLDEETETKIKQTLLFSGWLKNENHHLDRYYGTYNGYVIIVLPPNLLTVIWTEVVDGIVFEEGSPPGIRAWKDDNLFTLTELYEQGQLTREDLLTIQYFNSKARFLKCGIMNS